MVRGVYHKEERIEKWRYDCSFKSASESNLTKEIKIAYNIYCMKSTPNGHFVGLMTIASLLLSSCGQKEGKAVKLGVTEFSARQAATQTCEAFSSYLSEKDYVTDQKRQEEIQKTCQEEIEGFASGSAGIQRLSDETLAWPIAFSIMNELHSPSGAGAPWEYEGDGVTRELVKQILQYSTDLEPCIIGSSPECR